MHPEHQFRSWLAYYVRTRFGAYGYLGGVEEFRRQLSMADSRLWGTAPQTLHLLRIHLTL